MDIGELREEYARLGLETGPLKELGLHENRSANEVGASMRKLLEYNLRVLVNKFAKLKTLETLNLAKVIHILKQHTGSSPTVALLMHYTSFLKYFGDIACHPTDVELQGHKTVMLESIFMHSKLLIELLKQNKDPALEPEPRIRDRSNQLWIGDIPLKIDEQFIHNFIMKITGLQCQVMIKFAKQGPRYAFANFANGSDAKKAFGHLKTSGMNVRLRDNTQ